MASIGNPGRSPEASLERRGEGETHNGLPVIPRELFDERYNTDIRKFGEDSSATFDFQGYVKVQDKDEQGNTTDRLVYKDVFATNGLLKGEGHEGIHIGIDGVSSYHDDGGRGLRGPNDVREYNVYVTVPGKLQQEKDVVCRYDRCQSVEDYLDEWGSPNDDAEAKKELLNEVKVFQEGEGWIVERLRLDSQEDSLAREKVRIIQLGMILHLERGGAISDVSKVIRRLERQLEDVTTTEGLRRLLPGPEAEKKSSVSDEKRHHERTAIEAPQKDAAGILEARKKLEAGAPSIDYRQKVEEYYNLSQEKKKSLAAFDKAWFFKEKHRKSAIEQDEQMRTLHSELRHVKVLRSDGSWSEGEVIPPEELPGYRYKSGDVVLRFWDKRTRKQKMKVVVLETFLEWQEEKS